MDHFLSVSQYWISEYINKVYRSEQYSRFSYSLLDMGRREAVLALSFLVYIPKILFPGESSTEGKGSLSFYLFIGETRKSKQLVNEEKLLKELDGVRGTHDAMLK